MARSERRENAVFSLSNKTQHVHLQLNAQILPQDENPTSLGGTFDHRLRWKTQVKTVEQKQGRESQKWKSLLGQHGEQMRSSKEAVY